MKKTLYLIVTIHLATLFACNRPSEELQNNNEDSQVVLGNLADSDRAAISRTIRKLSACQAKIIAINAIFPNFETTKQDSMLLDAIRNAHNVVLASDLIDGKIVSSDSVFMGASIAQGVIDFGVDDDQLSAAFRGYIPVGDQVLWSFPVTVVSYFDIDKADQLMNNITPNTLYDINMSSLHDQSLIIDTDKITDSDCTRCKDKIVILGYLGPDPERDSYRIRTDSSTFHGYSTVIIANVINQLLKNDFKKTRETVNGASSDIPAYSSN